MPTRGEQPGDRPFTLEEIIAEVKSEEPAERTASAAAPKNKIDIDIEGPKDELGAWLSGESEAPPASRRRVSPAHAAPTAEKAAPPKTAPQALTEQPRREKPAPEPTYSGRHAVVKPPSEVEQIFADLSAPEATVAPAPAPERAQQTPPWRTAPRKPERPPEPEPPEDEPEEAVEPEPEPQPKPRLPYDLLNRPCDDPSEAAETLQRALPSLSSRMLLTVPILLTALYMTICGPLSLPMPFGFTYTTYPFYYQLVFSALQALALLIASPCTTSGLWRLLHGRPTLDTLVLFSGLCSLAHSVSVVLKPEWGGYLPYTCVSVLTCFFALLQKRQRVAALRRSYKAIVMGTVPTGLKLHIDGNRIATAVKTAEGGHAEAAELAEPDTTERFSVYYAPLAMVFALAFAAISSFGREAPERFLWALAAISSVCAPIGLLLSASAPAKRLSKKLFTSGSTLVSGQAARQLAKARALVIEDNDLFPAGAVTVAGMKVADQQRPETVVACAAALLQEVGGGLARAFSELARQQYIAPLRAEDMRFFETGGISAKVGESHVLLGSANFLMRMGVRVTEGLQLKNSLFLAIDGMFAGIFSLRYGVQPPVYSAFGLLRRAHVQPILALRDFITNQSFIESQFDLRTDSTEYPVLSERLRLSAPSFARELPTLAVLSRDGLMPAAEALAAARQLTRSARTGRLLGLLSAAIGMLLLYFLSWRGAFAAAAPYNVLLYLLLWAVPADLASRVSTRL